MSPTRAEYGTRPDGPVGGAARRRPRSPLRVLGRRLVMLVTLLVGGTIGAMAIAACLVLLSSQLPFVKAAVSFDVEKVGALDPLNERSIVFDRYGRTIAVLRSEQNRSPVGLARVPKHVIEAVLDVEDADFYVHKGVNLRSTIRAVAANVEAGGVAQGGSTITQQLVKLTLLTPKQDINRKVTEARLALQIEKEYSKAQILERYLNSVYLGEGAYGLEAAAERYFNTGVDRLDIAQGAFLAGMIRNPTGYDPIRFRERSRQRRSTVLDRMVVRKHLSQPEADKLKLSPMPRPVDRLARPDTYFIEKVKQTLLDDQRLGETSKDRYNAVFNGGLRIYTTFDPVLQVEAERAVVETLPNDEPDFTAALVSVDATSGAVRALVGGRGFETDKYDLATQGKRQPGSSWKPFIFIAALESGLSPLSSISGIEPCPIPNPGGEPDPFEPSNAEPGSGKVAVLGDQLVASSNCAFARLAYVVGYDKVADVAKRLGISTNIDLVPAMALGVEEVHPIDMAGAYATIASEGILRTPYFIGEVKDRNNKSLFKTRPSTRRVIDVETARIVTAAMRRVVTNGTGTAARLDDHEAAGKTGTTNNYEDAWFVGFTPTVATAVWMGAPDRKIPMRDVGGIRVFGGSYPARIWHAFMTEALRNVAPVSFTDPDVKAFPKGECIAVTLVRGKDGKLRGSTTTTTRAPDAMVPGLGGRGFAITVGSGDLVPATLAPVPAGEENLTGTTVKSPTVKSPTVKSTKKRTKRTCVDVLGGSTKKRSTKPKVTTDTRVDVAVPVGDSGSVVVEDSQPAAGQSGPAPGPDPASQPQSDPAPVALRRVPRQDLKV